MNKGFTIAEVLASLLIMSVLTLVILGFLRTGNNLFSKSFKELLIQNDYDKLTGLLKQDISRMENLKTISLKNIEFAMDGNTAVQWIVQDRTGKIKIFRQGKEIILNHIKIKSLNFYAFDKYGEKSGVPEKIIIIKPYISYLDQNSVKTSTFELFTAKPD